MSDQSVHRTPGRTERAITMRGEKEEAIRKAIIDEYNKARMIRGDPLEWYGHRVGIGAKTLERSLAGRRPWGVDELIAINRDLNNDEVSASLKKEFELKRA